jgi:hypothetical protein
MLEPDGSLQRTHDGDGWHMPGHEHHRVAPHKRQSCWRPSQPRGLSGHLVQRSARRLRRP